jgi:bifunctional non-homologous end joining protein LigD
MPKIDLKKIAGARKASFPKFISPQLATLMKEPPQGENWMHELKFDGYRMVCHWNAGKVQFWSRNRKDWTSKFPSVAKALKSLKIETAVLDGEIVIMDAQGRTSFQRLQQAMGKNSVDFVYEIFDLLYLNGYDLTKVVLRERKQLLEKLLSNLSANGTLRYSDHFEGDAKEFFKRACEHGIEGIISKRPESIYESTRTKTWLKIKCERNQEFVVVGYTPSVKGMAGFGSLILGVYERGKLIYAGRVGTGFSLKQRVDIAKKLDRIALETSPLAVKPKEPGLRSAHWAEPILVAAVSFTEWTDDGAVRHPSFQGFREDKNPREVRREIPASK